MFFLRTLRLKEQNPFQTRLNIIVNLYWVETGILDRKSSRIYEGVEPVIRKFRNPGNFYQITVDIPSFLW